jgi:hypothetical protein
MHDLRIAYVAFALLASKGADARGRGGSHSGARSSDSSRAFGAGDPASFGHDLQGDLKSDRSHSFLAKRIRPRRLRRPAICAPPPSVPERTQCTLRPRLA